MRVLLDTCIIIDHLQGRAPFAEEAKKVFLLCANNVFNGYITAKSVTDIYYLTHHATSSIPRTREILGKLFSLFDILDTAGIDCQKALLSPITDYEDAVMEETALRAEIDCIVTRNIKDFKNATVKVCSPAEFLKIVKKELF